MKSRSGFVSNSSTSSFIILGFKGIEEHLKEDGLEAYELAESVGLHYKYNEGDSILGRQICSWSDYDEISVNLSLSDFAQLESEVKEGMKKLGLEKEIRLYAGTYSS